MSSLSAGQSSFIDFLLAQDVLKFGEFTLNSGRISPYFFNMGEVSQGQAFADLGSAYADAILATNIEFDLLFGPAYKGIPIAVATAVALAAKGVNVGVAFNRKEAKDHGEGGMLVGAPVSGRVLMVDDVLTSGKAIRSAAGLIQHTDAEIAGVVIAMDRQEIVAEGPNDSTAVQGLSEELQAPVISIATMSHLIEYLSEAGTTDAQRWLDNMLAYQAQYCLS